MDLRTAICKNERDGSLICFVTNNVEVTGGTNTQVDGICQEAAGSDSTDYIWWFLLAATIYTYRLACEYHGEHSNVPGE